MQEQVDRALRPSLPRAGASPVQRNEPLFKGFPEFRSNVLYCPKQFFTVVVPHSSVNCIRVVAYMLRKTLGWVDESGEPIQERHEFSHRELERSAGVSHSRLAEALEEALRGRFIRRTQKARVQVQGVRAQSAAFELCWEENHYTDDPKLLRGFYLQPTYIDQAGQNRLGRKNIPNVFFDYLIRNESRGVVRVVGTLLWYSIDWGKGGERKQPVKKSLRELEDLTQLDKSSVVRALDEAERKGYVERIERGVFDLSGNKESSTTVYGIRWTSSYTYTYDGLPVELASDTERSQNATQDVERNAPKMQHGASERTPPKRNTAGRPERSQNATRNAPKTRREERPQNATRSISKTSTSNTSIPNNSNSQPLAPAVAAADSTALEKLLNVGFSKAVAQKLLTENSAVAVLRQIELLPKRSATKNRLGLLRRAIEENWPAPEEATDVGSSLGSTFAAHFYAGYHGNPDAPVSLPSSADSGLAESFVTRLLQVAGPDSEVPAWGRQFGDLVAYHHRSKREKFPSFQAALRQYGDDFFARLQSHVQAEKERRFREAQASHYERYRPAHLDYLRAELITHTTSKSPLGEAFASEEQESLARMKKNPFGLRLEKVLEDFNSDTAKLERFERFLMLNEGHGVLDFWSWDKEMNEKRFQGGTV